MDVSHKQKSKGYSAARPCNWQQFSPPSFLSKGSLPLHTIGERAGLGLTRMHFYQETSTLWTYSYPFRVFSVADAKASTLKIKTWMLPWALRSSFGFVGPRRFSWGLWVRVFDESVLVTHNRYPWDTNTTVHYTLHVYKDRTLMLNITTVLNRIKHLISKHGVWPHKRLLSRRCKRLHLILQTQKKLGSGAKVNA